MNSVWPVELNDSIGPLQGYQVYLIILMHIRVTKGHREGRKIVSTTHHTCINNFGHCLGVQNL